MKYSVLNSHRDLLPNRREALDSQGLWGRGWPGSAAFRSPTLDLQRNSFRKLLEKTMNL